MSHKRKSCSKADKSSSVDKRYRPSEEEIAVVLANFEKAGDKRLAPSLKTERTSAGTTVSVDHPDYATGFFLLQAAVGTTDSAFLSGLMRQLSDASQRAGDPNDGDANFLLSVVKSIEPQDEIETMLAAQMAATHAATMTFAARLGNAATLEQQESAERGYNRLARTFATQAEALKRYRTGGQQKVTVEHVTVNEGGQAIVGNIETGGRGGEKR